jgi:hypothetical protein
MISTEIRGRHSTNGPSAGKVDMKLEVALIPVSDVDRAKEFYEGEAELNRPGWYAACMVAKAGGTAVPQ